MNADAFTSWTKPSAIPELPPGEIHVWRISLANLPESEIRLKEFLSPDECDHAGRFHFAPDCRRFLIRRASLRQLLAAYLTTTPSAVPIERGVHGKPFITGQTGATGLRFSCTHSQDWALIAFARGLDLGLDLEWQRPMADAADLAENFFSEAEISELESLPEALKTTGFFNAWTRKEAFVKALGLGLSFPLDRFTVSLAPDEPAALLAVANDPDALKQWTLVSLDDLPDYSAALVFENKPAIVKLFSWPQKS